MIDAGNSNLILFSSYIRTFLCIAYTVLALLSANAYPVAAAADHRLANMAEQVARQFLMEHGLPEDYDRLPYTLNHPAFSNYSGKYRELRIPSGGARPASSINLEQLPLHSLIVKAFYYRVKQPADCDLRNGRIAALLIDDRVGNAAERSLICPVEVRILHLNERGWRGHVYVASSTQESVWRPVHQGKKVSVTLRESQINTDTFEYDVPSIGDCANCHFGSEGILPIGLADENGVIWLSQSEAILAKPPAGDQNMDPESLARQYLEINCAHCHSREGLAASSALYLDAEQPLGLHLGLCKPVVASGSDFGVNAYAIQPGDAESSVIIQRMRSRAAGKKMPELGQSTVDHYGIQLVSDWIDSLDGGCQ